MYNARYQHYKAVMNNAEKLDIELLLLPPYSANLNVIESLWKFVNKSVYYEHYYDKSKKNMRLSGGRGSINEKYQKKLE